MESEGEPTSAPVPMNQLLLPQDEPLELLPQDEPLELLPQDEPLELLLELLLQDAPLELGDESEPLELSELPESLERWEPPELGKIGGMMVPPLQLLRREELLEPELRELG